VECSRARNLLFLSRLSLSLPNRFVNRRFVNRRRANSAHIRLSRPDYGLGFYIQDLKSFQVVPSSPQNLSSCSLFASKPFEVFLLRSRAERDFVNTPYLDNPDDPTVGSTVGQYPETQNPTLDPPPPHLLLATDQNRIPRPGVCSRAKRKPFQRFQGLSPENQDQKLVLTVL
jgi:hypothetical protein